MFVKASIKGLTVINALAYYTTEFITAGLTMTKELAYYSTEFITAGLNNDKCINSLTLQNLLQRDLQ